LLVKAWLSDLQYEKIAFDRQSPLRQKKPAAQIAVRMSAICLLHGWLDMLAGCRTDLDSALPSQGS